MMLKSNDEILDEIDALIDALPDRNAAGALEAYGAALKEVSYTCMGSFLSVRTLLMELDGGADEMRVLARVYRQIVCMAEKMHPSEGWRLLDDGRLH